MRKGGRPKNQVDMLDIEVADPINCDQIDFMAKIDSIIREGGWPKNRVDFRSAKLWSTT